jgi:hypothetical protein
MCHFSPIVPVRGAFNVCPSCPEEYQALYAVFNFWQLGNMEQKDMRQFTWDFEVIWEMPCGIFRIHREISPIRVEIPSGVGSLEKVSSQMDTETLLWFSLLFSSIGIGYFVYGKKQRRALPLMSGVVLCVYPYFVTNPFLFFGIGAALVVLPFFIRV